MKYSVLVVNFNMAGIVNRLLRNLDAQLDPSEAEIIVADNSDDPRHRLEPSQLPVRTPVRVVYTENRGLVDALNRIIPLAAGQYVMIMHPDVELRPGCLQALSAFLEQTPQAGVVSPDLCYPNGFPCRIRLRFPTPRTEAKRLLNTVARILLRRKLGADEVFWNHASDTSSEMVMGVCMLFRRAALEAAAPIEPQLVFYYSNDFLCWRLRQAGWTCHYAAGAQAIHFERFTPKDLYSESKIMAYKEDPIAANPQMRTDFYQFLSRCYPLWQRIAIRVVSLAEDGVELAAQFVHPWERKVNIHRLAASLWLGVRRPL